MLIRVLLVDPPDVGIVRRLRSALSEPICSVDQFDGRPSRDELVRRLKNGGVEVDLLIVFDQTLELDLFEDLMQHLRRLATSTEALVVLADPNARAAASWMAAGALATVDAGLEDDLLGRVLDNVVQRRRRAVAARHLALDSQNTEPPPSLDVAGTKSPAMREVLQLAQRVAASDSTILLLGESGVGKEWLARGIHAAGSRPTTPFVAVNCAAVPESLLESELFGHERGSFTGAERTRRGYFELAHRGTLFLDEIGEMPANMQTRLLRVLQDRTVRRVGGETAIDVDVRILAATNRPPDRVVGSGGLREDLYYRLAVVTIEIPPLRERREDILALFEDALRTTASARGRTLPGAAAAGSLLDVAAARLVRLYRWPGNVRELINVAERALLLCDEWPITADHLPRQLAESSDNPEEPTFERPSFTRVLDDVDSAEAATRDLATVRQEAIETVERAYLEAQLRACDGNLSRTARRAGIDPRTLYNKMRQYGLRKDDFKRHKGSKS